MSKLFTDNAPSAKLVIAHYLVGGMAFTLMTLLLIFSLEGMNDHYFQPDLLATTHMGVLGWITTIIFGALIQLLPVILNTSLYSERFSWITLVLLFCGTGLLSYGFWHFSTALWIPVGGGTVLLAFILFAMNVLRTIRKGKKRIQADFIATAVIWLLVTGSIGLLTAINFSYPFLQEPHLEFLHLHAHFGLFGWFLLLIIGVASELIPMFLVAKGLSETPLKYAYYSINAGLFLMILSFFLGWPAWMQHGTALLFLSGILAFGYYLRNAYRIRLRKRLDIGMRISTAAFLLALLPIVFGVGTLFLADLKWSIAYGSSILLGCISFLVIGQSYKTLPFIVWLWKYQKDVGKKTVPMPADLYDHNIAEAQFWTFLTGFLTFLAGLLANAFPVSLAGGLLLLITGLLYQGNMFRIVFQNPPDHEH